MCRHIACSSIFIVTVIAFAQNAGLNLGRTASEEDIRARNITVLPNGTGLPTGHGSAKEGRPLYNALCASCHGQHGEGVGPFPPVAGGVGTLKSDKPVITVGSYWPHATTVWDYINRAMPPQKPGSLAPNEVYSTTAYTLYLSGVVQENEIMDAVSLPKVKMPNREGFVPDPRPDTNGKAKSRKPR
jgi:hypothetical protein